MWCPKCGAEEDDLNKIDGFERMWSCEACNKKICETCRYFNANPNKKILVSYNDKKEFYCNLFCVKEVKRGRHHSIQ